MKSANGAKTTIEIFDNASIGVKLEIDANWVMAAYTTEQARELARVLVEAAALADSVAARRKA